MRPATIDNRSIRINMAYLHSPNGSDAKRFKEDPEPVKRGQSVPVPR